MRVSQKYTASKYLKAEHLKGLDVRVKIARIEEDVEMGLERDLRDVVFFEERNQGLVLNRTNAETLAMAYGDDSDDWIGATVILYTVETAMGEGIRIRPWTADYTEANPPPYTEEELAEIPFS